MNVDDKAKEYLLAELRQILGCDQEAAESFFEDNYRGEFESLEDYARNLLEDTASLDDVPIWLQSYIDYAAIGRDEELGGGIFTIEENYKSLHVFLNQ